MTTLRFERPADETALADWRHVHNVIVPPAELSLDEVRERAQRYHLEVAYLRDTLIGCSTVRPPVEGAATVIARVLPEHRRQGYGEQLYRRGLTVARELGAEVISTVVLSSNPDGLQFALKHGFAELERYQLPGETVPWIDLRLVSPPSA